MSLQNPDWERHLLSLAIHPKENHQPPVLISNTTTLEEAYAYCDQIIAEHSKSFYMASSLLPPQKRIAARVLYAFCRISDNIVDLPSNNPEATLHEWRTRTLERRPSPSDLIAIAWADVQYRYRIPKIYAEQLIDGVAVDLIKSRYETFPEVAKYAYGVASTVGLMVMHIVGFNSEDAIPYAVKLGLALQMTNILRDVGEDLRNGRVYLPQEELDQFGVTEEDLQAGRITEKWGAFMRFQIDRNRRLYQEALPGIGMLHKDGRFSIAAAAKFYAGILDEIEANQYNVFTKRAVVSTSRKLTMLPSIWWQAR
ncbi:MAG: squalene/phytoene synthase family protein [Anaerolineales bacterium]